MPDIPLKPYTFDTDLIQSALSDKRPKVRIYSIDKTIVVLGKGGKIELELNTSEITKDGVDICRRQGGGCSVVIDPGNVIISLIIPVRGIINSRKYFDIITEWIIDGLKKMGIEDVKSAGTSDIAMDDLKISGSCIYNNRDYLYYSATLLFNPDLSLIEKYLCHPPREPEYRKNRDHSSFVTAIKPASGFNNITSFIAGLQTLLNVDTLPRFLS